MADGELCPYCKGGLGVVDGWFACFVCDHCMLIFVKDALYDELVEASEYGSYDYLDYWDDDYDDEYS